MLIEFSTYGIKIIRDFCIQILALIHVCPKKRNETVIYQTKLHHYVVLWFVQHKIINIFSPHVQNASELSEESINLRKGWKVNHNTLGLACVSCCQTNFLCVLSFVWESVNDHEEQGRHHVISWKSRWNVIGGSRKPPTRTGNHHLGGISHFMEKFCRIFNILSLKSTPVVFGLQAAPMVVIIQLYCVCVSVLLVTD